VASASAYHEAGPVGPFNLSFDMNTTMEYKIIVEGPFSDATSEGVKFTRYYLTVDSTDYFAVMALTEYETPMLADINANMDVVAAALQGAGADQPKLYQPLIDGQPGVLGSFRFEKQQTGPNTYTEGDIVLAASYSPDGAVRENGEYRGKTNYRIISTFPWEIIRDLLYTLHVEVPKEEFMEVSCRD